MIDGDLGWVIATNAARELPLGISSGRRIIRGSIFGDMSRMGSRSARGLEFGTTGLHQPFPVLIGKPQIFGRPTFTYLDAGESATRSYSAFLIKVPQDFAGVDRIQYRDGRIVVHERGDRGRELTMAADRLW